MGGVWGGRRGGGGGVVVACLGAEGRVAGSGFGLLDFCH